MSENQPLDPRPRYARAREQMAGLIALVGPEQLDAPTPCTEYDVRLLLTHIVGGCNKWTEHRRGRRRARACAAGQRRAGRRLAHRVRGGIRPSRHGVGKR